jgi:hypothetical protein
VDTFALIMLVIVVGMFFWVLFLGLYHPRSARDVLDWRPTRSAEMEVQNELDDVAQMLEATNQRRRARGEPELTEDALRARVEEDLREANERRERYLADTDLQQMLAATNERRRRRGEAELSEADYRARVEADRERLSRRSD